MCNGIQLRDRIGVSDFRRGDDGVVQSSVAAGLAEAARDFQAPLMEPAPQAPPQAATGATLGGLLGRFREGMI